MERPPAVSRKLSDLNASSRAGVHSSAAQSAVPRAEADVFRRGDIVILSTLSMLSLVISAPVPSPLHIDFPLRLCS